MKNDTFDDVRYFLLGLQIANTADVFVDKSLEEPKPPNDPGGDSSD